MIRLVKKNNAGGLRRILLASATYAASVFVHGATMAQDGESKVYSIPPSDIGVALQAYSEQADVEIIYVEHAVEGKMTDGVNGLYSREAALQEIIRNTDLNYEVNQDGVIVIRSSFLDVNHAVRMPAVRTAQAPLPRGRVAETINPIDASSDEAETEEGLDVVIVTGTNIRGIAPESSPVRSFDRQDILNSGVSTAQDFIQLLPQNFGGGANADIAAGLPNDDSAGFNTGSLGSLGSSVNLRGLGSGSTLVLLNGHRIAPSSGIGDFVDISMIPASAIERVDVLTDGASSIYGADAVAGVVNFVLRDDYDGVESSFRYGTVTEGNLDEYRASITGGKSWNSGNALFVYEYFNQENLSASDRAFSQGVPLPQDLLPSQERHSLLASTSQKLMPSLEVFGDFIFSTREAGQDAVLVTGDVIRTTPSSRNLSVSAGGAWEISDTWFADVSGTYSDVYSEPERSGATMAKRELSSSIWTADAIVSGVLFDFIGGDLKLAVGGHFRTESFSNFDVLDDELDIESKRDVYAVFGEMFIPVVGPDNAILGIKRFELSISGRFEDYSDFGSTANPKVGFLWSPVEALRLRGSYSTSFNPPPLGRIGAVDLTASALPSSFINGVFGLTPGDPSIATVVVLSVGGTSTDLDAEQSRAFTAGLDYSKQWGVHDFKFSATFFDIEFENRLGTTPIPGNSIVFDAPNIAFNSPELFPEGSVIFSPQESQVSEIINNLSAPLFVFPGIDPFDAEIINTSNVLRNLARTLVQGVDFDFSYTFDSDIGIISLGLDGTYLRNFQQQGAITTPLVEQVDTLFNPVDLRLRGRAGFVRDGLSANLFMNYSGGYREDSSIDALNINSWTTFDVTLSYNTRDRFDDSLLNNTTFRFSALNIFDENPPVVTSDPNFFVFGYDPTNASPLNRFVSLEIVKEF